MRSTTRQFTQCYLILAHFQHSKFNTVYIYIYRIAPLTLGTLHYLCVCMVTQLHALSAQQNKHLLSAEFSQREYCLAAIKKVAQMSVVLAGASFSTTAAILFVFL